MDIDKEIDMLLEELILDAKSDPTKTKLNPSNMETNTKVDMKMIYADVDNVTDIIDDMMDQQYQDVIIELTVFEYPPGDDRNCIGIKIYHNKHNGNKDVVGESNYKTLLPKMLAKKVRECSKYKNKIILK